MEYRIERHGRRDKSTDVLEKETVEQESLQKSERAVWERGNRRGREQEEE